MARTMAEYSNQGQKGVGIGMTHPADKQTAYTILYSEQDLIDGDLDPPVIGNFVTLCFDADGWVLRKKCCIIGIGDGEYYAVPVGVA